MSRKNLPQQRSGFGVWAWFVLDPPMTDSCPHRRDPCILRCGTRVVGNRRVPMPLTDRLEWLLAVSWLMEREALDRNLPHEELSSFARKNR